MLDTLGTDNSGFTFSQVRGVNRNGAAAGYSSKYDSDHNGLGSRAVR